MKTKYRKILYNVLIPVYSDAGKYRNSQGEITQLFNVNWRKIGEAYSMREAKKLTKFPVLEPKYCAKESYYV